ncbi:MAG: hypothetical protein HY658_00655 [Actinobacteria bacterium]|nr:hypothetical protein [Actinomycetota bacterium]
MIRRSRRTGLLASALVLGAALAFPVRGASSEPATPEDPRAGGTPPLVRASVGHDTSEPLRVLAARAGLPTGPAAPLRGIPKGEGGGAPQEPDPAVQEEAPGDQDIPAATGFEGIANQDQGPQVLPPDPNGEIGPNHYVQMVNVSTAVYDRAGNEVLGPFPTSAFWAGFAAGGGVCRDTNQGDPIVLYDQLADRWLVSQFGFRTNASDDPVGPYYQCVAVSTTPDPTGTFHRYAFKTSDTKLNDYPKLGVWPDGYYLAYNQFIQPDFDWGGQGVAVLERSAMLAGQPARMVSFDLFSTDARLGAMLPTDLDGTTLPPAGTPNPFIEVDDETFGFFMPDQLQVFRLSVNWVNPTASSFTGPSRLWPADFDPYICPGGFPRNCIPQPGTDQGLDPISDRLMFRLAYRNTGPHETLVVNHTVDAGAGRAGIRWYELRRPTGSPGWSIEQQGTFAPADGLHRWMGSTAMDRAGDIALGYSVSSGAVHPGIRYTGRLAADPPGTMTQGEGVLMAGTGSQTSPFNRWGDYSDLTVDPVDDCTFWYTNEYYSATGDRSWRTRIGSFRFTECVGVDEGPALSVDDVTVAEGDTAVFTVRLDPPNGSDTVTVDYATASGSATQGTDFPAVSGSLEFPPGEVTRTVSVPTTQDAVFEHDETFFLRLTGAVNATIADPEGMGTILNDDEAPKCPGYENDLRNQVVGTPAGEELVGTEGPDIICGLGGNDTLLGLEGDDLLIGGGGNDVLLGHEGNDTLLGGGGADELWGGPGADTLNGGAGADLLVGGGGPDTMNGGAGPDILFGEAGADTLNGGRGADILLGQAGKDGYRGGGGFDYADFELAGRAVTANLTTGKATGEGRDTLKGIEALFGSRFGDLLIGNAAPNVLFGWNGADDLRGRAGNDHLDGGRHGDSLNGGPGFDVCLQGPGTGPLVSCERTTAAATTAPEGLHPDAVRERVEATGYPDRTG